MKHEEQQKIWDEEHAKPNVLLQMDSSDISSGVVRFKDFLNERGLHAGKGIELGCGKGRNVIGLAGFGFEMHGLDFSPSAISEAKRRADAAGEQGAHFDVADATIRWPHENDTFDFGIDCFASTDIESKEGRIFAISEMYRVLKPGAYFLAYLLSTEDEFHAQMIREFPGQERNSFVHPTGKFEKVYDEIDILETFSQFEVVRKERMQKTTAFNGKDYQCKHYWIVLRK